MFFPQLVVNEKKVVEKEVILVKVILKVIKRIKRVIAIVTMKIKIKRKKLMRVKKRRE